MALYILTDTPKVTRWKSIILGQLHTTSSAGLDSASFCKLYPAAESDIIDTCFTELLSEGEINKAI